MVFGAVGYAIYLGRNWDDEEETKKHESAPNGWGFGLFYNRVKARLSNTLDYYNEPMAQKLLPDEHKDPNLRFPFTLVLSLEDMLIHNEWTREHGWRIAKRPGLDYFLRYLSQYYELVLFTSQPSSMADQVLRKLDPYTIIQLPLFREATLYKDGGYVKASHMITALSVSLLTQISGPVLSQPASAQSADHRYGRPPRKTPARKRHHPSQMERRPQRSNPRSTYPLP
jgi:import inner membrane translocase subunit TIM50